MDDKPLRLTNALVQVAAVLVEHSDEQHWAYDLAKRAGVGSNAVYSVLKRLHERKWISDGWEDVDPAEGRPARRYYEVTPLGLARLGALLAHAQHDRRFASLNLKPGLAQ